MPQCVGTQRALWVLLGAPGAEGLRVRPARPRHSAFQVLQSKTWCADGEAYYGGSFDFSGSRSSLGCNLVVIRDLPIVRTHEPYIRRLWNEAYGQVAEKVRAEHSYRFREIWYPTDGPLADPGGLLVAPGDDHPDKQFRSPRWEGAEFLALQVRLSTAALVAPMPQHSQHLKA